MKRNRKVGVVAVLACFVGCTAQAGPSDWISLRDSKAVRQQMHDQTREWTESSRARQERVFRGTIADCLSVFPHIKSEYRWMGGRGMIYSNPNSLNAYFALVQVKSVQGNDLVLGPVQLPGLYTDAQEALRAWTLADLWIPFDEEKNFGGMFFPYGGNSGEWTFAVLERTPDRPKVAEYIFYRKGPVPSMQSAADVSLPKQISDSISADMRASFERSKKILERIRSIAQ